MAYKLLYYVFCEMETETLRMLKTLTAVEVKEEAIKHSLDVRKALASGNYGRFFKLYRDAPNMSGYLMDIFIDKHRTICMQRMCLTYQATNVAVRFMSLFLAYDTEDEFEKYLAELGKRDQLRLIKFCYRLFVTKRRWG